MKSQGTPVFFVTGASGFVGSWLCRHLSARYSVTGTYHSRPNRLACCTAFFVDITNHTQVLQAVESIRPSISSMQRRCLLRTAANRMRNKHGT
ncbi:MAG: NAD-dependent epimerase/dehydratase family protein [Deltaproteobacteria bacterium]|nr:NAD-dependent epimerase/dehydratase family protein [Deltaproteobacteria bacterium]